MKTIRNNIRNIINLDAKTLNELYKASWLNAMGEAELEAEEAAAKAAAEKAKAEAERIAAEKAAEIAKALEAAEVENIWWRYSVAEEAAAKAEAKRLAAEKAAAEKAQRKAAKAEHTRRLKALEKAFKKAHAEEAQARRDAKKAIRETAKAANAKAEEAVTKEVAKVASKVNAQRLIAALSKSEAKLAAFERGLKLAEAHAKAKYEALVERQVLIAEELAKKDWDEAVKAYGMVFEVADAAYDAARAWCDRINTVRTKIAVLRETMTAMAKDADDIVARTLARGELAKKHAAEEKANFSTNVKKKQYDVDCFLGIVPKNIDRLLRKANDATNADEYSEAIDEATAALDRRSGKPFKPVASVRRPLSESSIADSFGVEYNAYNAQLAIVEYGIYDAIYGKGYRAFAEGSPELEEAVNKLFSSFVDALLRNGVLAADGRLMKVLSVNSTKAKQGKALLAEESAYEATLPFLTLGQDLTKLQKVSGEQIFKGRAILETPSTVINLGSEKQPKYITLDDVIMLPTMTLKIKVPKSVKVGDGSFTVQMPIKKGSQTVDVPIKVNRTEEFVEIDAFDGLMITLIRGFQPKQLRDDVGDKGFSVSDRANGTTLMGFDSLLDFIIGTDESYAALRGQPVFVRDVDGELQEVKEGKVLANMTNWKMSFLFDGEEKPWAKCQANVRELRKKARINGKVHPTFGCLREASSAESGWDDDRHTSRQLLQSIWMMKKSTIQDLVRGTIRGAKEWKHFSGALLKLGGFYKTEPSAMERFMRQCPEIAAERHMKDLAITRFLDAVAEAGSLRLDTKAVNAFICADPTAFIRAILRYSLTGELDVTDIPSVFDNGQVYIPDIEDGVEMAAIRYPLNGGEITIVKNVVVPELDFCGRVAFISHKDVMILVMDGDFDGDHAQFFFDEELIAAIKYAKELGEGLCLNWPVLFSHAGKEDRKPYDPDFIREGMKRVIVNGQRFNFVGRFSKAASRFAAMANALFAEAAAQHRAGNTSKEKLLLVEAAKMAMIQKVFAVGAIDCIDWAKKGVPEKGSEGRRVFDACLTLLDWAPAFGHGKMLWEQTFCDHNIAADFVQLSQPIAHEKQDGTVWYSWTYATPTNSIGDQVAAEVCNQAGIRFDGNGSVNVDDVKFDDEGVTCDVAKILGWKKPARQLGKGIVTRAKVLRGISTDIFETVEDQRTIEAAKSGNEVSVRAFVRALYRAHALLEKRLAKWIEEAKDNAWAEDVRSKARVAYRNLVLQMSLKFEGSARERYDRLVDEIIDMAFELTGDNGIARNEKGRMKMVKKARFTNWLLTVFGEDFLFRAETVNGVPEEERTANIRLCDFSGLEERIASAFISDAPAYTDEELAEMAENVPADVCPW